MIHSADRERPSKAPALILTGLRPGHFWPALNVKEGYEAATLTTKDGIVMPDALTALPT